MTILYVIEGQQDLAMKLSGIARRFGASARRVIALSGAANARGWGCTVQHGGLRCCADTVRGRVSARAVRCQRLPVRDLPSGGVE
jgi:hypothetical protein